MQEKQEWLIITCIDFKKALRKSIARTFNKVFGKIIPERKRITFLPPFLADKRVSLSVLTAIFQVNLG